MSIAATFGSGGSEPYARALRRSESNVLYLRDTSSQQRAARVTMDVSRWNAEADETDLSLLSCVTGPLIDIGCGPGRMVRAASRRGLLALGIDVSATAVEVARALGGSVLERSVFDRVPGEGAWQTALLIDGNVGIGGDIPALLARCRELLCSGGEILVELDRDPAHEAHYLAQLVDGLGGHSAPFPWAEIGRDRLVELLPRLGLVLLQSWEIDGRSFCRLASTR